MKTNKYILAIIVAASVLFIAVFGLAAVYEMQNKEQPPIYNEKPIKPGQNPNPRFPTEPSPEPMPFNPEEPNTEYPSPEEPWQEPELKYTPETYTCPSGGWINCMPVIDESRAWECKADYIEWAKANCPKFEGVAY